MILPKKVTASILKELILSKRRDRRVKIQVQFRVMGVTEEACCGGTKELSDQLYLKRRATEGSQRKMLIQSFKGEVEICPLDTAKRNFSERLKSMCHCTEATNNNEISGTKNSLMALASKTRPFWR